MSLDRALALASGPRRILGITGPPGAGKTTLARKLVEDLGDGAALVPMDGFHLANATLRAWGIRDRKGAPDTFDVGGFVALLRRLREQTEDVVHAPDFDRDLDESIGSAIPVRKETPLIVTEGNWLLSDQGDWAQVLPLLDECWYVDTDDPLRRERLINRHELHGMAHDTAVSWTHGTDENNARLVATGRSKATLIINGAS